MSRLTRLMLALTIVIGGCARSRATLDAIDSDDSPAENASDAASDGVLEDAGAGPAVDTSADASTAIDAGQDAGVIVLDGDVVCGMPTSRSTSYRAENGRVYRGDQEQKVWGLNWFGLESPDRALSGLWTRDLDAFMAQIKQLGFTALRVPLSPEAIRAGFASADWAVVGERDTGLEQLEALVESAKANDLRVLLSFHTCDPNKRGAMLPGSPINCAGYSMSDWLDDLERLAELGAAHFPTVLGVDLNNEPYSLTYRAWRDMAELGAQAVLCKSPALLVFVEGVGNESDNAGSAVFWGENLVEAGPDDFTLPASKIVFAPHVYGPSVSPMSYFNASNYPANLPAIWDAHFGHLIGKTNLMVGELGGVYDDAIKQGDVAWQDAFVDYLLARGVHGFFYWALNPNSGDTGGVLLDDWESVNAAKMKLLKRLMR